MASTRLLGRPRSAAQTVRHQPKWAFNFVRNGCSPCAEIPVRLTPKSAFVFARDAQLFGYYSAVAIASDASCGGCDLQPADVAAITARTKHLQAFLTYAGGTKPTTIIWVAEQVRE